MAVIVAKYRGHCKFECGAGILKGDKIVYRGYGQTWHVDCYDKTGIKDGIYGRGTVKTYTPSPDNDPEVQLAKRELAHDNAEYQKGVTDANNYMENKRWFGEEEAERMEIEKEFKEGWDY